MKKRILAAILYHSGILWLKLLWIKMFGSKKLRILCYHRVLDLDRDEFEFNDDLVDATSSEFEQQMQFVSKHFNAVTFEKLTEYKKKGSFPRNSLIITFDDGYKDNYEIAYPILKKYGIPATIFLVTDYIGDNKAFWWDKIDYYIKKTNEKEVAFELNGRAIKYDLSNRGKKLYAIKNINEIVTELRNNNRDREAEEILNQLEESLNVDISPSVIKDHILSWDNVREMLNEGIEFGSHTARHRIMTNLSFEEIKDEIADSSHKIEQETAKAPRVFAYPAGLYNKDCIKALEQSEIEFGCSYNSFAANKIESLYKNPYELKRMDVVFGNGMKMFKANLCFTKLMGLKMPEIMV